MAGGTVQFNITVDPSGAVTGIKAVNSAMANLGPTAKTQVADTETAFNRLEAVVGKMQSAVTGFIAAWVFKEIIGGMKDVVQAGIDFESSFARVRNTVTGTSESLDILSNQMIELSKTIPESAVGLNKIAEQAGRLGAGVNDIKDFVTTIAKMGTVTGESTEEMSLGFGKLVTALGLPLASVGNLGSMMVDLSTKSAASTSQILMFSTRLAGIANEVGFTMPQIAALAATMSSVGLQSERSGSAVIKLMSDMARAIEQPGRVLDNFAAIAGMTRDTFVKAFKDDAGSALLSFISGLNNAHAAGQSTVTMLDSVGEKNIRLADVILKVSGALDKYSANVKTATEDMGNGSAALDKLYKTMADTPEKQLELVKNRIDAIKIALSSDLLPTLVATAQSFASLLESLHQNADAVSGFVRTLTALGGTLATLKLVQWALDVAAALNPLRLAFLAVTAALLDYETKMAAFEGDKKAITGAIDDITTANVRQYDNLMKLADIYEKYGLTINRHMQSVESLKAQLDALTPKYWELVNAEKEVAAAKEAHTQKIILQTAAQEKAAAKFAESVAWTTDSSKATKALNEELGYALGMGISFAAMMDAKGAQIKKEIQLEKDELGSTVGIMTALDDYIQKIAAKIKADKDAEAQNRKLIAATDDFNKKVNDGVAAVEELSKKDEVMSAIIEGLIAKGTPLNVIMDVYGSKIKALITLEEARGNGLSSQLQPFADLIHHQDDMNSKLDVTAARIAAVISAVKDGIITAQQGMNQMPEGWQGPLQSGMSHGSLPLNVDPSRLAEQKLQDEQAAALQAMTRGIDSMWAHFVETGTLSMKDVGKTIASIFSELTSQLMAPFEKNLLKPLADTFGQLGQTISNKISGIFGGGSGADAGAITSGLGAKLTGLLGGAASMGIGAAVSVGISLISKLIKNGSTAENNLVQNIQNPFAAAVEKLMASFDQLQGAGKQTVQSATDTRTALAALWSQFQADTEKYALGSATDAKAVAGAMTTITSVWGTDLSTLFNKIDGSITDLGGVAGGMSQQQVEALTAMQTAIDDFNKSVDSTVASVTSASSGVDVMETALEKLQENGIPANLIVAALGTNVTAMTTQMQALGIEIPSAVAALSELAAASSKQAEIETQLAAARTALEQTVQNAITANTTAINSHVAEIKTWTDDINGLNKSITAAQSQLTDAKYWSDQYTAAVSASENEYLSAVQARKSTEQQIASVTTSLEQEKLQLVVDNATAILATQKQVQEDATAAAKQKLQDEIDNNDANTKMSLEARAAQHKILQDQLSDLTNAGTTALAGQADYDAAVKAIDDFNHAQKLKQIDDQQAQLTSLNETLQIQLQNEKDTEAAANAAAHAAEDDIQQKKLALAASIDSMKQQITLDDLNIKYARDQIDVLDAQNTAYGNLLKTLGVVESSTEGTIQSMIDNIGALEKQREALSKITGTASETTDVFGELSIAMLLMMTNSTNASEAINKIAEAFNKLNGDTPGSADTKITDSGGTPLTTMNALDAAARANDAIFVGGERADVKTVDLGPNDSGTAELSGMLVNGLPENVILGFGWLPGQKELMQKLGYKIPAGYATGTPYVPYDQMAFIHKGERIIPAAQNNSSSMGGSVIFSGNITINAQPGQDGRALAKQFVDEVTMNGSLRTKLKQTMGLR